MNKPRTKAEQIVVVIGDKRFVCSTAEEVSKVLQSFDDPKAKRLATGEDPFLRLQVVMNLVAQAPNRGVPPSALQAALGLRSARSVSGLSKGWHTIMSDLGFRKFDDVLVARDAWRNHSRWFPGKRFDEAKQALDRVIAEEV